MREAVNRYAVIGGGGCMHQVGGCLDCTQQDPETLTIGTMLPNSLGYPMCFRALYLYHFTGGISDSGAGSRIDAGAGPKAMLT